MTEKNKKTINTRASLRFEREAKALQKNLEKRKQQQKKRLLLKEKRNGHN